MKKLLSLVALVVAALVGLSQFDRPNDGTADSEQRNETRRQLPDEGPRQQRGGRRSDDAPAGQQQEGQWQGSGVVTKVLRDDSDGSRHQRFILRLDSGQTVLVAHNIDVAPRISSLRQGDTVEFFGEFERNQKGGVVHWTHHDPAGRHEAGWLRHEGRTYQ